MRLRLALAASTARHSTHTLPRVADPDPDPPWPACPSQHTICSPSSHTFYFGAHRLLSISVTNPRRASEIRSRQGHDVMATGFSESAWRPAPILYEAGPLVESWHFRCSPAMKPGWAFVAFMAFSPRTRLDEPATMLPIIPRPQCPVSGPRASSESMKIQYPPEGGRQLSLSAANLGRHLGAPSWAHGRGPFCRPVV